METAENSISQNIITTYTLFKRKHVEYYTVGVHTSKCAGIPSILTQSYKISRLKKKNLKKNLTADI